MIDTLWQDVRYGIRALLAKPGFASIAIITLALGIGANTAIFSVINAVLIRPLPFEDADRLVRIIQNRPGDSLPRLAGMSTDDFQIWRTRTQTLSHMALYAPDSMTLTGRDEPVRIAGASVSPALFPMLGARPLLGRVFDDGADRPGNDAVVVLSHAAWQQYFAADADVVGSTILLDGRGYAVTGVMPATFEFPDRAAQYWTPFTLRHTIPTPGERRIQVAPAIARVSADVSIDQAEQEASIIFRQLREAEAAADRRAIAAAPRGGRSPSPNGPVVRGGRSGPSGRGPAGGPPRGGPGPGGGLFGRPDNASIELVTVQDELVAPVRPALVVLVVAVGFVLLIACANVANLLLARAARREHKLAVRAALGAGRTRLVRQLLTESTLLALVGGLIGAGLAVAGIRVLSVLGVPNIPRIEEIAVDTAALAFTVALSLLTGFAFGLAPALRLSRRQGPVTLNAEGTRLGAGFGVLRGNRTRSLLAVGEMALATMLLIGAGLLVGSFTRLSNVDPGYEAQNVLTFQVGLPQSRYGEPQRRAFYDELLSELRSAPGVEAAALANTLPLEGRVMRVGFGIQGRPAPTRPEDIAIADVRVVSADYVTAMGLDVVDGRPFTDGDREGQPPVVLVSETLARRYFAGQNPVGQRVRLGGPDPFRIVGVVGDVRHAGLDAEPQPEIYLAYRQAGSRMLAGPGAAMFFTVRTAGNPVAMVATVRTLVRRLDSEVVVDDIASMEQRVADSVAQPRFYAATMGLFAAVALVLASIGIYGVMAYSVSQRTREIGIRMALGAGARDVLRLILGHGVALAGVGMVFGLLGAALLTRYLERLLFGLTPLDPSTFLLVSAALVAVATLACYIPASRAMRVDPSDSATHRVVHGGTQMISC